MSKPALKKICTKCGQEKEIKHFYKHPTHSDGRRNDCKQCVRDKYQEKKRQKQSSKYFQF